MSFEINLQHRIGACPISVDFTSDARVAAITGPSGIGKTSVLHCVAGLIRPETGRIAIGGTVLFDSAQGINVPVEHRRAGYVFQDARLFPHLTVAGNLAYGERGGVGGAVSIYRSTLLDVLALPPLLDRWPATLSGGETRRVAIARALLSAPAFLLMDEPLTSLDQPRAERILGMIEALVAEIAIPVLYVSHQPEEVARLTGTILSLNQHSAS